MSLPKKKKKEYSTCLELYMLYSLRKKISTIKFMLTPSNSNFYTEIVVLPLP